MKHSIVCGGMVVIMSLGNVWAEDLPGYDFHYAVSGDEVLAPIQAFDDGKYMYLQFKNRAVIPVVLVQTAEGMVRLPMHEQFPYVVIEQLAPAMILKSNGKQALITYIGGRALLNGGGVSRGAAQVAQQNPSVTIASPVTASIVPVQATAEFRGELEFSVEPLTTATVAGQGLGSGTATSITQTAASLKHHQETPNE